MKKLFVLLLALCLSMISCSTAPSSPESGSSPALISTEDMPLEGGLAIKGKYIQVQFPEELEPAKDGALILWPLMLQQDGRVLIWQRDTLWWVDTADGSILSRQELKLANGFYERSIRAEVLARDGYDYRVIMADRVITGDSNGEKEPQIYTLPENLSDTLTDFEGRHIPFALSPDGSTLAYTDADGCWLASADGGEKELVFANSGIGQIMGSDYSTEILKPWYWEPRFLDNGLVLVATVYDQSNAGTRAMSILRLETGEVRHYSDLYGGLGGSFQYFDDTILINRTRYIDTRDFSEYTRPALFAHTWDGDYFWEGDSDIDDKVLLYSQQDLETPVQLLQVENGQLFFMGMTRTITLWGVESAKGGEPPMTILVPYR